MIKANKISDIKVDTQLTGSGQDIHDELVAILAGILNKGPQGQMLVLNAFSTALEAGSTSIINKDVYNLKESDTGLTGLKKQQGE